MKQATTKDIAEFIKKHNDVVIVQADNPDADSLGSALALEQILHEMGKEPYLYCGVSIPSYLSYMEGWDRVSKELPHKFDASIIVDTSALHLLDTLEKSKQKHWLAAKPCLIIDHHDTDITIDFASLVWNRPAVATGEHLYALASKLRWTLNHTAKNMITLSILADSLGLTSEAITPRSVYTLAELVEQGVSLSKLEQKRRKHSYKTSEVLHYKGKLLQRVEFYDEGRIATVTIPWEEIVKYSHEYNPSVLVLEEMRSVKDVEVSVAFKIYRDGKITAKIRSNWGHGIAKDLSEHFGGGGHTYASGFKITDGRPFDEIKKETIAHAVKLLKEHKKKHGHETL